ncbi:MAG: polysaccharide biosynthesis/export family protein [Planktothrix sp.]
MFVRCVCPPLTALILVLGVPLISVFPVQAQTPRLINPLPPKQQPVAENQNPVRDFPYLLGVGDRLRVDVFGVERYGGEQSVLADGTISLQGIGPIQIVGLTLVETQKLITRLYSSILRQPIVTVNLTAPRPVQIAIAGEVYRPGSYNLAGDQQFARLTQAIKIAGGLTQAADLSLVQLRRATTQQPIVTLNLAELLAQGNLMQDPILRDGDSIFVPTMTGFNSEQMRQIASSSLAAPPSQSIQVVIVGAVFRPGAYSLSQQGGATDTTGGNTAVAVTTNLPTITRALQTAGGITNVADIRNIEVQRITRTGVQTTTVNLWELLQSGDINQDVFLQEGDTIIVPTADDIAATDLQKIASASFSPSTITVNVVGEVKSPGLIQIPPNRPLNQALLSAGGFENTRANKRSVELIRLNPNGSVTRRTIDVDFELGNAQENNPVLHNNDVIIVRRSFVTRIGDGGSSLLQPIQNFFTFYRLFEVFIPSK